MIERRRRACVMHRPTKVFVHCAHLLRETPPCVYVSLVSTVVTCQSLQEWLLWYSPMEDSYWPTTRYPQGTSYPSSLLHRPFRGWVLLPLVSGILTLTRAHVRQRIMVVCLCSRLNHSVKARCVHVHTKSQIYQNVLSSSKTQYSKSHLLIYT